jgi:ribose transport system substrate-binding protein
MLFGNSMKRLDSLTVVFVMAASLLVMSACRKAPPTVAVIPRTTATLLWEPLHLGVAEIAKNSGQRIYWNAPPDESDPDNQLALVLSCAKKGIRGVIYAPDGTPAARSAILQLTADHIPVVIVDDDPGPPPGAYLSYVSTDEDIGTDLAAGRVAELLHGHGSIAIMGINPRLESGISREASFERALALRAPDIRIVVRRFGSERVTPQQQLAQQILERADPVNAIVALTGTATRGAFYAELVENPHLKIPLVGFDQDLLTPILTGDVDSIIVQDTRTIGQVAMLNLLAQMRGESVQGYTRIPPLLLTRKTLNSKKIQHLWEFSKYQWSSQ